MLSLLNSSWKLGSLTLNHRLIQGPLAGYSCAPMRRLFNHYQAPAYCVSEMISAIDILSKHVPENRYLYRAADEHYLCYQIAGTDPIVMADAAIKLQQLGADIIDINCGCPKGKIRKKGAGSALLENPALLIKIIETVRKATQCPLTVKIRIQNNEQDLDLARRIADTGVDALIVHGRRWDEDYDVACNAKQIALIKQTVSIPVIANGDIQDCQTLQQIQQNTGCDVFMIGRAGTGKPWLYQELLTGNPANITLPQQGKLFLRHLQDLAVLDGDYQAVLQSKSLIRYYFREWLTAEFLQGFYRLDSLEAVSDAVFELTA